MVARVKGEFFDDKNSELKIFLISILFLIILTIPSAKAIATPGFDSAQVNLAYLSDDNDDDKFEKSVAYFPYTSNPSKIDSYRNRIEEKWDYELNYSDQVNRVSQYNPPEIGAAENYGIMVSCPSKNRYNGLIDYDKFYCFLSGSDINFLPGLGGYA